MHHLTDCLTPALVRFVDCAARLTTRRPAAPSGSGTVQASAGGGAEGSTAHHQSRMDSSSRNSYVNSYVNSCRRRWVGRAQNADAAIMTPSLLFLFLLLLLLLRLES